jgi:hypothetical protein
MYFYKETMSKLNNIFCRHWPLVMALSVLWVTIVLLLIVSFRLNQGHFVYGLDDAYIHMSIAKNFALHGVWGVTPYAFSSSSSSLLWTLLLSLIFYVIGVNVLVPFILNIILSTITIFLVYYILRFYKIHPVYNFMVLVGVVFFTPLSYLIFIGMEHILQIILVIVFVFLSVKILTNLNSKPLNYYLLLILTVPLAMVRYESLILIFLVAFLFILRRKFTYSFLMIALAIIPITIYGVISISNGWSFLPNSVILKSTLMGTISNNNIQNVIYYIMPNGLLPMSLLAAYFSALVLIFIAAFRLKVKKTIWDAPTIWLIITGIMIFIEFTFINSMWYAPYMLRYSSYLIVMWIIASTLGLYDYLPRKLSFKFDKKLISKYYLITIISIIFVILLYAPLAFHFDISFDQPQYTNNIYEQQYQMASFLSEYYPNGSIAANDIGAINYYNNIKCLDLFGLGSNDAAQARENNTLNAQKINNLANQHHVEIAIIYNQWDIPSNWIEVGEWTTPHSIILGDDTVHFYATSPQYENELLENLKSFSPQLPKDIKQNGLYTEQLN